MHTTASRQASPTRGAITFPNSHSRRCNFRAPSVNSAEKVFRRGCRRNCKCRNEKVHFTIRNFVTSESAKRHARIVFSRMARFSCRGLGGSKTRPESAHNQRFTWVGIFVSCRARKNECSSCVHEQLFETALLCFGDRDKTTMPQGDLAFGFWTADSKEQLLLKIWQRSRHSVSCRVCATCLCILRII